MDFPFNKNTSKVISIQQHACIRVQLSKTQTENYRIKKKQDKTKGKKTNTPTLYFFMQFGGVLLNRLLPYLDRDTLERNMLFATTPQV